MPTSPASTTDTNRNINLLYVVLHGLITLVDHNGSDPNNDGFTAYVLDMGDDHRYLYGNWLVEEEIPVRGKGQLPLRANLIGVDKGFKQLDPALNLIVQIPKPPSDTDAAVRAIFNLPKPRNIFHFISGTVDSNTIMGKLVDPIDFAALPTQLSGIRVFEYTFQNSTDVRLETQELTLWSCPEPAALPDRNVAVLHIYNEPGSTVNESGSTVISADHNVQEFDESTKFLGVQLTLDKSVMAEITAPPNEPPILGLLPGEVSTLDFRTSVVLNLLHSNRMGVPPQNISPKGGVGTGGQLCSGANAVVVPKK